MLRESDITTLERIPVTSISAAFDQRQMILALIMALTDTVEPWYDKYDFSTSMYTRVPYEIVPHSTCRTASLDLETVSKTRRVIFHHNCNKNRRIIVIFGMFITQTM